MNYYSEIYIINRTEYQQQSQQHDIITHYETSSELT